MKRFWFWFGFEFLAYALVVANGRAYNQGLYAATFLTDMLISANAFYISKKFIADHNKDELDAWAMWGCILGGATGSICTIYATKLVYGQ